MNVHHVLSVEIEEVKRQFIIDAHTPAGQSPEFCLFDDVAMFDRSTAYCYTCCKEHSTAFDLDVLFTGPSCKNCSYEFSNRAHYADCYTTHDGTSGSTYQLGFKKAIEQMCPAVAFFENTAGVADSVKNAHGIKQRPRTEAGAACVSCQC